MREKFELRSAGGVSFYIRRDPESQREVAFAVSGDYLLLATREDLLAGALQLMSGTKDRTVEAEQWWSQSVAVAGTPGDLRMVMNLEKIVPSPYFRTYWVQQNITDLKQYSAAVSDLFRSSKQYREERVLIPKSAPAAISTEGLEATAGLVRLVPENASFYEAKAYPSADACLDLMETKLLAPHLGPAPASQIAPQVQLTSGETGASSDLETRIDQPVVQHVAAPQAASALKELLDETKILAALQVQSSERDQGGIFVRIHSALVLLAASDWDQAATQSALAEYVRPGITASQLGVAWQPRSGYQQLDGLWPLVTSVHGKYLVVADDPGLMEAMLAKFSKKPGGEPAALVAGFNHEHERNNFARLTGVVDRPSLAPSNAPGMERAPQFFSENVGSLSSTFTAVSEEKITIRNDGGKVRQTVTYEWAR